jgi:hypothetical protein
LTRFGKWLAFAVVAQCLVAACARRNSHSGDTRGVTAAPLLPRVAYLIALDSSLPRVRPAASRVLIYSADSRLPFTAEDLRRRRLKLAESASVCAGEAALWFHAPQRQENEAIRLDVVEVTGQSGLAGGRSYLFRCSMEACRLEDNGPLNSDYMVGCRVSTWSSAVPVPASTSGCSWRAPPFKATYSVRS